MNDDALLARNKLDIGIQTHIKLRRGWVLSEIKANRTYLGQADTFEEYLSQYDARSDANECMRLYKFYIVEHGLQSEDIDEIHHDRLLEVMKAIKLQPDKLTGWLELCTVLSWKDLINAVRETRGRAHMPKEPKKPPPPGSSCIICGTTPVENAHWPITEKMGGTFTIPLCHDCHIGDLHNQGDVTWYSNNKHKIMEWLATLKEEK